MDEQIYIDKLKENLQSKIGRELESPADYDILANEVKKVTREFISPTTIKRIFGYIHSDSTPRTSSLGILARYLGFKGWTHFSECMDICSGFITKNVLFESQLHEGDMVHVEWSPNRKVTFMINENRCFEVTESENAKIQLGDEMSIMMFAKGQPLQVKDVMRDGRCLGNYVAGTDGGLTKVKLISGTL